MDTPDTIFLVMLKNTIFLYVIEVIKKIDTTFNLMTKSLDEVTGNFLLVSQEFNGFGFSEK